MCEAEENCRCEKPEELKTKPEECSQEQISKCHCDTEEHPCVEDAGDN